MLAVGGTVLWFVQTGSPAALPVAIAGLGVTLLLMVPLSIHATARVPLRVEVVPVDPRQSGPEWLAKYVETSSKNLAAEGFVQLGAYTSRGQALTLVRIVLRARETGDVAVLFGAYLEAAPTLPKLRYVAFFTELAGNRQRSTSNRPDPSNIPPPADRVVERFPQVADPVLLYRIHRALVDKEPKREPTSYRESGAFDPAQFILGIEQVARKHQLALGYFVEDGAEVRPTWKGAFLMGLPRAPIVGSVLEARVRLRAAGRMRQLGF
ncbi:MAG TPA: hypothetical protein VF765_08940 [Polyangiaceae bacterium]